MTKALDPASYWKLRAICTDTSRAHDALLVAQKRQTAVLIELGFGPAMPSFTLNDETLEVNVPDTDAALVP